MAYEQPPGQPGQPVQGQQNYPMQPQGPPGMGMDPMMDPYGYSYPGDMWAGRGPSDQAAQMRKTLFEFDTPKTREEFEEWVPMLRALIDGIARTPGYDQYIWAEVNRDFEDLVDRAHSQGRSRVVASKMQKFFFKIRSLVPKSDVPLSGLSGVGAMITTNQNVKQDIRYPQQPATQSFLSQFNPFSKRGP